MKRVFKKIIPVFLGIIVFFTFTGVSVFTEDANSALACLDAISEKNRNISSAMWEYVKAAAHTKNLQKIENTRKQLIKVVKRAIEDAKKMSECTEDKSLRDSYIEHLNMLYFLLTEDYAKLVDMEAIAEESYDAMEAYFLAKKRASEKMNADVDVLRKKTADFAKKNNINIIYEKSEIAENLEKSAQVMDYYNEIYLIFFKSYKQELYLINSVNKENINEIEQNRVALLKYANEGLNKLKAKKSFANDRSLKEACEQALLFYKKEAAEKALVYIDYLLKRELFLKVKKAFELKKESERTQADVDNYNKKVEQSNKASEASNKVNEELNRERQKMLDKWNKTKEVFIDKHIPK